jgi:hypothetical protein
VGSLLASIVNSTFLGLPRWGNNKSRPTSFFMTELEKIACFDKIKALLDTMDKDDQRLIAWSHLTYLVALDRKNLPWILEHLGILIQTETAKIVGGFHS